MSIHFSADRWTRVQEAYSSFWAGKLDRPLISVTLTGYESDRKPPAVESKGWTIQYDDTVSADAIVDRWDYDLSTMKFLGDAFPHVLPNFGPGVAAAFMGAKVEVASDTVWFGPPRPMTTAEVEFAPRLRNPVCRRIASIMKAAAKRWNGQVQVDMTDLGGSMDLVASFRPGEELLMDLYDHPGDVKKAMKRVHKGWWKSFEALAATVKDTNPGFTCWTPILSKEPYYMIQCDFAYMIGPEMFDEFVKPEIVMTCKRLQNSFYHLDGVGQLPHLDSLLSIPELSGIQWVPGDGQAAVEKWPEVYRKVRAAGKLIQVFSGQSPLGLRLVDELAGQLGSARGIIMIGNAGASQEAEVRELLARHGVPAE